MGEVYRGRDPRLDREVAIKVLPTAGLADAERRRRFRQEARAASALNHPHIVTIYEIETADGTDFIVMEFIRGKGLDALIPRKGMRLGEVLRIGIAVADALAAAHERGIVHRDLKPANVMIGTDGGVKVVDFGLAKLRVGDDRSRDETNTLTDGVSVSAAGVIAGTAAYMSPEQAMGEEVDARSDIFSFGAMLYEMATGVRAFAAASAVEILSAVVREQPRPPTQIVATVPSDLERVILRCLRKDRDRRFQTIRDVAVELREIKDESDSGQLRGRAGADRRPVGTLVNTTTRWALLGFLAIVAAVGVWRVTLRRPQPEQPLNEPRLVRVTAQPAADPVRTACVSPDGRYVAFSDSAGVHVWVTASGEAHLIPFTANMDVFAWSSDGSTIKAGRSDGRTYVSWDVPLLPGPPRQTGVRWPASDIVAFSPDSGTIARLADNGEIWLQRLDGSATNIVYRTGEGVNDRSRVSALAWTYDGSGILFANALAGPQVYVLSSNQSSPLVVGRVAANSTITGLIPLPNRHILASGYGREGSALWDLGEAGREAVARRLSAFNDGVPILLSASHDGRWLAFQLERQQGDVYTAEFDASQERIDTPRRLTLDERDDLPTAWTPDGKAVLFFSARNGPLHIFKQLVGDATAEQLVGGSVDNVDPRVSSDGKWIYFQQQDGAEALRTSHIMRIPIDGGQPEHVHSYSGGAVHAAHHTDRAWCSSSRVITLQSEILKPPPGIVSCSNSQRACLAKMFCLQVKESRLSCRTRSPEIVFRLSDSTVGPPPRFQCQTRVP